MKIAILSDSHKKPQLTFDAVQMLKEQGAQYLIHAGDLEIEENLKILKQSGLPYVCVFGNNDYGLLSFQNDYPIKKEPYYFKIKDLKFKLMHLPFYMSSDSDIIVFGHTHKFETYMQNDSLFINPGEVCARNKPLSECVLLEITKNDYEVNRFFKSLDDQKWDQKKYIFPIN